jgi:hypothetical protein
MMNKKVPVKISIAIPLGQINNEEQFMTIEIIKNDTKNV